jgi:hypothetical protein
MKCRNWIKRAALYAAAATAVGVLLAGCAGTPTNTANGCVGPPDFCTPFFGS